MFQLNNKKRIGDPKFLNSLPLPTANSFSALADSEKAMETNEQVQTTKKVTVSPIVVTDHTSDIESIFKDLNLEYNLKMNSIGRKILPKSTEEKSKLIEKLKEKNINFFSHPDNNKTFKVILSGLPQVDTALIETCLKEQKLTPTKITMFNTQSARKLYLLHFNADEVNKKTLEPIKYVHHHVIAWLPFKPKRNGPTQCMQCLMYGHGISSCNRYTVCMLCAGAHSTKECTANNNKNNTNPVYTCFNCMSQKLPHNHKANDATCPFRQKYELARNNARSKTSTNKRMNPNAPSYVPAPTPPPQSTSYADSMRTQQQSSSRLHTNAASVNNTQTQARTNTNTRSTYTPSNANVSSGPNVNNNIWSIEECSNILFDSIERLQNCKTKFEQLKIIADLLKHACT